MTRRNRPLLPIVVGALLCLLVSTVGSLLHRGERHVRCEHGHLVHAVAPDGGSGSSAMAMAMALVDLDRPEQASAGSADEVEHGHAHCALHATASERIGLPALAGVVIADAPEREVARIAALARQGMAAEQVFRLAPKNSPPA